MSRSRLEFVEQSKYSNKDSVKSSAEQDQDNNAESLAKRRIAPYESVADYSHYDQQYAAFTNEKAAGLTLNRRLNIVEDKISQIDYLTKQNFMLERKLEELALQFDRFTMTQNSDRSRALPDSSKQDVDQRVKQIEDRCDLINSKLDKGLLILQRDIQDFERANQHKIAAVVEDIMGSTLQGIGDAIKNQDFELEDNKQQIQLLQKQVQMQSKLHQMRDHQDSNHFGSQQNFQKMTAEYLTPERTSPYQHMAQQSNEKFVVNDRQHLRSKQNENGDQNDQKYVRVGDQKDQKHIRISDQIDQKHVRINDQIDQKHARIGDQQDQKHVRISRHTDDQDYERHMTTDRVLQITNQPSKHQFVDTKQAPEQQYRQKNHSFAADVEENREEHHRNDKFQASNEYDETRRKIDDEISRRLMEEQDRRRNTLQKESDIAKGDKYDQSKFKHTPMSTEKSRSKEIQNRLTLERKTKQEKINQLNECLQMKKK